VKVDVDKIRETTRGADSLVSGLVYDVSTGLVETVVPPTR
jgi:carbonic anhydrase